MQIIINNLLTTYSLSGKGKLVVLLHGWGDSSKGLQRLHADLAKSYAVLSLDLPGFGATQKPNTIWGLDEYGLFIADTLRKLELKSPYAIVGHSNGGAIAIRGLATGVLRAEKLILLAAAGIRSTQKSQKIVIRVAVKAGKVATFWLPTKQRATLRKALYGAVGSDMLVVPELEETFKKTVSQDVLQDASAITIPTLLLYAKEDSAVPLEHGRLYAKNIPNAKLQEIDGAGHFIHIDQPEIVTSAIMEFLQ